MRRILVLLVILAASSGCTREGGLVINLSGESAPASLLLSEIPPAENESSESSQEEPAPANETHSVPTNETPGNQSSQPPGGRTGDPCSEISCDDSVSSCQDGFMASCTNACLPETGRCSTCTPDCSGHMRPPCQIECGECGKPDLDKCECILLLYCDGNGICEPTYDESDEWPDGADCIGFRHCDDDDNCTQDVFDPNQQACQHRDICCNDNDPCTVGEFNFTSGACEWDYLCCGDGVCDPRDGEVCPDDCAGPGEASGEVRIVSVDPEAESVALEGYSVDMTNYTLSDNTSKTFRFPDSFVISGNATVYTQGSESENDESHLYWGRKDNVWNNDHDTATLRNSSGDVISVFEY